MAYFVNRWWINSNKRMHRIIILFSLLALSISSFSQFNDSIHYYLRFASTGIINKTNDGDSYVLNNALNFNIKKKIVSINTSAGWIYGVQKGALTNNDFSAHSDVGLYKDLRKLYYWGLVNFDKSYSLKIKYRLQAGGGIAYNIINDPLLWINVSDGILYEKGDIIDAKLGRDVYQIPRNSFRLSYRWSLKDRVIISGIHFYQPSLIAINDYIIQSTNNLSVKLKKWLSLTAAVVYNKVSRTNRENLLITYGLTLEKYF
ncbi:MAG: DUF481 domain-containing protein [Chitinophagaceae bacterium]